MSGGNAGNNPGAVGLTLGANNSALTGVCDVEIACWGSFAGEPTPSEKAALDAWVTSYYGASVQT